MVKVVALRAYPIRLQAPPLDPPVGGIGKPHGSTQYEGARGAEALARATCGADRTREAYRAAFPKGLSAATHGKRDAWMRRAKSPIMFTFGVFRKLLRLSSSGFPIL